MPRSIRPPVVGHPTACACANTTDPAGCDNAQACYWYQQGCSIGCPTCDSVNGRKQIDLCGNGMNATINKPEHRTVNRAAKAGSDLDVYRHNSWRAPGSAGVVDACGMAGGAPVQSPEWGNYVPTKFAKQGDHGSVTLPEIPTATVWTRGATAEVTWQVTANHGGGYYFRLCKSDEPLTEACFQRTPVPFAGATQKLVWADPAAHPSVTFNGTFVSEGTVPAGSTWALNPIPARCLSGDCHEGKKCAPLPAGQSGTPCDDTPEPAFAPPCDETNAPGLCSGNQGPRQTADGTTVAVVDTLRVPAGIAPGKYVLGWRWDCEATAQIWTNCADITIV